MKILITVILIGLLLIGPGCAGTKKENKSLENSPAGEQKKAGEQAKTPAPAEKKYPPEVANWIEVLKPIYAGSFTESGGKTYILLSWGRKKTGGYQVERVDLKDNGDKVILTARFKEPPKGSMLTQVLTTPYLVETVNHPVKEVQFADADGKETIPVIRGLSKAMPFINQADNIKIMDFQDTQGITVSGLARVFEANVAYEIQAADKKPLRTGSVLSAGGAPDWGYFKIKETFPMGARYVEVFNRSPKDGEKQNILTLEIK